MHNLSEEFVSISGMEEWPSPQPPFAKKNFKRKMPEAFEDELDELANSCTKMKKSDTNKILIINEPRYNTRSKRGKTLMTD